MNSRRKGKRGELEACTRLKGALGVPFRRTQQFCGRAGDADIVGIAGLHVEVKHVEKLNIYEAMGQAMGDAKDGSVPVVVHRRNRFQWLITLCVCDIREFCRIVTQATEVTDDGETTTEA